MVELRLRSKVADEVVSEMAGKMLLEEDLPVRLVGPARVLKPDGTLLCVYLPEAMPPSIASSAYPTLHSLKNSYTSNRGLASGSQRVQGASQRSYAKAVDSAIVGSFEATGPKQYCRLTAWTGRETEQWVGLWPYMQQIAKLLAEHVPDRYANQVREAEKTSPEWVIPNTPFTTVTVNNTYATGIHKDKGDLDAGFSTLTVLRSGRFKGGVLGFPEFGVGVDMRHRDVLLMDAHSWHGNTPFSPEPKRHPNGTLDGDPGFERISVVCYFRTKMTTCGTAEDEAARQQVYAESRSQALVGE
jgi:hypothetical protein